MRNIARIWTYGTQPIDENILYSLIRITFVFYRVGVKDLFYLFTLFGQTNHIYFFIPTLNAARDLVNFKDIIVWFTIEIAQLSSLNQSLPCSFSLRLIINNEVNTTSSLNSINMLNNRINFIEFDVKSIIIINELSLQKN